MRQGITVKDIALRIAHTGDTAERTQLVERLRYWTRLGLLTPLGSMHEGTGRWRTYPNAAVYVAAVLYELATYKVSLTTMNTAALAVGLDARYPDQAEEMKGSKLRQRIEEAKAGKEQVYMTIRPDHAAILTYKPPENGIVAESMSSIILNLTMIFKRLR